MHTCMLIRAVCFADRTPGVEQNTQTTVESSANHNSHNTQSSSNLWSTTRRFPTTLTTATINQTPRSTTQQQHTPPVILGKRAPTPSPTNRIPLPLNGVLTKSLSSSSASAPESTGRSSSAIGNRMTKAMSGIAGKVQKKIVPNIKRNDQPVRSTQV